MYDLNSEEQKTCGLGSCFWLLDSKDLSIKKLRYFNLWFILTNLKQLSNCSLYFFCGINLTMERSMFPCQNKIISTVVLF